MVVENDDAKGESTDSNDTDTADTSSCLIPPNQIVLEPSEISNTSDEAFGIDLFAHGYIPMEESPPDPETKPEVSKDKVSSSTDETTTTAESSW